MDSYVTLADATAELTVLRSRFLSFLYHIESEEEGAEKLAALRKKYYDATHVCYAYVSDVNGNIGKSSDDGEPSSTAGAPIMSVITGGGYRQVLIAVVRYFGGTKLGVGGLIKAYTDAANGVVERAEKREYVLSEEYTAETDYNSLKKITNVIKNGGGKIKDTEYGDRVKITVVFPRRNSLIAALINATGGKTEFINRGYRYEIYQM